MRRFCVRCGALESNNNPLIDHLCLKCFLKERTIAEVPKKLEVVFCPSCGRVYIGGRWLDLGNSVPEVVEALLNNYTKLKVTQPFTHVKFKVTGFLRESTARIEVNARVKGIDVSQTVVTDIKMRKQLCPQCHRIRGKGFEAVVQIRSLSGLKEQVSEAIEIMNRLKDVSSNVSEVEWLKEGVDIRFLSQGAARKLANVLKKELGAKVKLTWKQAGVKGGKRHSKLTISVRLPGLKQGDLIILDNRPNLILNVTQSGVEALDLSSGRKRKLSYDALWSSEVKYLREGKDYVITYGRVLGYQGGKAVVQLGDTGSIYYLQTLKMYEVGEKVKVLVYKGVPYLMI